MSFIEIPHSKVVSHADMMTEQLRKSWPKTLEDILNRNPYPKFNEFFIYTFAKWEMRGEQPQMNVYHQCRLSMPDAFWNTTLRKINKKNQTQEIIWTLPSRQGAKLYEKDKIFEDSVVATCIRKKHAGELDLIVKTYNDGLTF